MKTLANRKDRLDLDDFRKRLLETEDVVVLRDLGLQTVNALEQQYLDDDDRHDLATLKSLRGMPNFLGEAQALRLLEHLKGGGSLEFEAGVCRTCRGSGYIDIGSGCFGMKTDDCPNCHRKRIVTARLKAPPGDKCICPDWFAPKLGDPDYEAAPEQKRTTAQEALKHHEYCPKRIE